MDLRLAPLEIPPEDPFKHDTLKRKPDAERLCTFLRNVTPPFVVCLDSPWGTGKTTFIRLCKTVLSSGGTPCVVLNAWESDFAGDPLVALLGEVQSLLAEMDAGETAKRNFEKVKSAAKVISKRALPALVKLASAGVLDVDEVQETILRDAAGELAADVVEAYTKEKAAITTFKESLAELVTRLNDDVEDSARRLVVFVDELDRCRPSYAIECLERIKHMFDLPNIVFVLAVDKRQLVASVHGVYGPQIQAAGYLSRFMDVEYHLPLVTHDDFLQALNLRLSILEGFKRFRTMNGHEVGHFVKMTRDLVADGRLSLRDQVRFMVRLRLAMDATPSADNPLVYLMVPLVFLRMSDGDLYRKYVNGECTSSDVVSFFRSLSGRTFINSDVGTTSEAWLAYCRPRREEWTNAHDMYRALNDDSRSRRILEIAARFHYAGHLVLELVAKRIELGYHLPDEER